MTNRGDAVVMVVCGLALLAAMAVAHAQALSDPTRPPAMAESPSAAGAGAPAASGVQTIIHSNCGKPAAIINGAYVVLGGRVGDARLIAIGEDTVTLKSSAGRETLKLMPGVEKTPVSGSADAVQKKGACVKSPEEEVRK